MSTIALLISSLHRGGSERVMSNIAAWLADKGHRVLLVTQYVYEDEYPVPDSVRRILCEPPEEETARGRVRAFAARFRRLRNIWKEEKPDVILSFIGKNNVMAVITSLGLSVPVAVSVRSDPAMEYEESSLRKAALLTFRAADAVIVMTNRSREFFPQSMQQKLVVLPNPVSPEFLTDLPEDGKDAAGATDGREGTACGRHIVSVGRVDANKNHRRMIEVFDRISADFPDTDLTVYGDGELLPSLREYASSLPSAGRIFLPGATDRVRSAIDGASLFLLCSDFEGIPNALLEAMALGIPCISTDCPCGGPADLIADGENGLLIPMGDPVALETAMRRVLSDPDLASRLSEGAVKVRERYAPERVLADWERTLLALTGNRRTGA